MATVCDSCGKRDNEVKSGSGIEPMGTRITLRLTDPTDLSRDVLKVISYTLPATVPTTIRLIFNAHLSSPFQHFVLLCSGCSN